MAKAKTEPKKSKPKATGTQARAHGRPSVSAGSSDADAEAAAKAAPANARGSKPRKTKTSARSIDGSAANDREPISTADPEERDDDESPASGDGARDDDTEVVEVVGEIVDDTSFEGEDAVVSQPIPAAPSSTGDDVALSRTDPLQAYLREVQRHSLLTPDEEKALTMHYQKTQDVATAARLVTANLRLVVKLAYEYRRAYKNIMDLIQEGNIGLMQAVKRYDPYRGVKLSSYAAWWIRAYILRFILNNWRLVKLGTTQAQRKLFFNLNKEKAKLSAMGIDATPELIAERLNVETKDVIDMDRRLASGEASLDAPVGDSDGRSVSRLEMLPSAMSGPDIAFERSEMGALVHERLQRFRATLKGKDVIIFDKRMAAEDPLTLQELGDEFGISRERVRQLEARLTMKLRQYLKDELGDAV